MRKRFMIVFFIMMCFLIVGCLKKEKDVVVGGWSVHLSSQSLSIPEEALNAFKSALKNKKDKQVKPIALLGTQVVAGTNYMFFCSNQQSSYKMVVVYKDLENHSAITKISDFDITKYAGKNIEISQGQMMGGWTVNRIQKDARIEDDVMNAYRRDYGKYSSDEVDTISRN